MILSLSLDLGTTRIKAAALCEDGTLEGISSAPAPPLTGEGLIRESDPEAYVEEAMNLLQAVADKYPPGIPLGIASQRSTFLLWERESGRPVTPLISWQDRRAAHWCEAHRGLAPEVTARTGLPLSPHYAGPKLAHLFSEDRSLRAAAKAGSVLLGTPETWLVWKATRGLAHISDISMAGRTLLADPAGGWSKPLLDLFGVPPGILPRLVPSWKSDVDLSNRLKVTSLLSDQAAAFLAVSGQSPEAVLVNLGTGGFVLLPTGSRRRRITGYLSGPLGSGPLEEVLFCLEGTINGIGRAVSDMGDETPELPEDDPRPDLYCLPDTTGAGSPFWRPDLPQLLSSPLQEIAANDLRRAVREGIIFRVRQIVDDLAGKDQRPIFLSGGLAGDRFLSPGLAACLERPLYLLKEREATLLGAARMAAPTDPPKTPADAVPAPPVRGGYLSKKFHRWTKWANTVIRS